MLNFFDILNFFKYLNEIDQVTIEENQNDNDVTLENIKFTNTGNNCLHYALIHNKHRIVIQTYKELDRKGDLDIVQGKPELESLFEELIDFINARPQDFTDDKINKLFVLYCGLWDKNVNSFYEYKTGEFFNIRFNSKIVLWYYNDSWRITADDISLEELNTIFNFITAMEDICQ